MAEGEYRVTDDELRQIVARFSTIEIARQKLEAKGHEPICDMLRSAIQNAHQVLAHIRKRHKAP